MNWFKYFTKKEQVALGLLLLIGMAIRITALLNSQLWRDEVYNFFSSKNYSAIDLLFQNQWDTLHASFYFVFLHFWSNISIDPDFLRVPSIFLSFCILYLTPILAKKLFPKLTYFPFVALFLVSFSQTLVSLNVVARPYPFVITMMLISFILFLDIVNDATITKKTILAFVFINTWIGFTDYSGVWLIMCYYLYAALCLFVWETPKKIKKNIYYALGFTALCAIPWVTLFLIHSQNSLKISADTYKEFYVMNPIIGNLWQLSFYSSTLPTDIWVQHDSNRELIVAGIILALSCIGFALAFRYDKKSAILLSIVAFFPFIASFLFSIWVSPIFIGRNLNVVHLSLLFGLGIFITAIARWKVLLVIPFVLFFGYNYYMMPKRVHFTDPPYDWERITEEFTGKGSVELISYDPEYMFTPINYYNMIRNPGQQIRFFDANEKYLRYSDSDTLYFIQTSPGLINADGYGASFDKLAYVNKCYQKIIPLPFMYFARCIKNE